MLLLDVLIYRCSMCDNDTTIKVGKMKDIRKKWDIICPHCKNKEEADEE